MINVNLLPAYLDKTMRPEKNRMISLDAFRGMTIAGMILVNNPGTWLSIYSPLKHADWNGCTPTDLIFPFFLFIMGVAITLSLQKRSETTKLPELLLHIVRRSVILFLLGIILAAFPGTTGPKFEIILPAIGIIFSLQVLFRDDDISENVIPELKDMPPKQYIFTISAYLVLGISIISWVLYGLNCIDVPTDIRIPGVLQRIALCYLFSSLILMFFPKLHFQILWTIVLIIGYWILIRTINVPADFISTAPIDGRLHDWIDSSLLGKHLYSERPDPEGILSTIPAIATTMTGVLCGYWLKAKVSKEKKLIGMFVIGNLLIVLGLILDYAFPFNKKIWSSSYVVYTSGLALEFLAMCNYLLDYLEKRIGSTPFLILGTNSIVAFFASSLLMRIFFAIPTSTGNFKQWLYSSFFASFQIPQLASLAFALSYLTIWILLLSPLFYKKIFIKI